MPRVTPHRRGNDPKAVSEAEPEARAAEAAGDAPVEAAGEAGAEVRVEAVPEGFPDDPLAGAQALDAAVVGPVTSEQEALDLGQAQLALAMALRVRELVQGARRRGGPPPA